MKKLLILLSFFPSLIFADQFKPIESLDIDTDEGLYEAFARCTAFSIVRMEEIQKEAKKEYRVCMGNSQGDLDDMDCELLKVIDDSIATGVYGKRAENFGKWSIVVAVDLFPNVSFEFVKNNAVNTVKAYSQRYSNLSSRPDETAYCFNLNQKYPPIDED